MPFYSFSPRSIEDLFPCQYVESCAVTLMVVKWCVVHLNSIYLIGSAVWTRQAFEVDKTCLYHHSILFYLLPFPVLVFFSSFLWSLGPSKLIKLRSLPHWDSLGHQRALTAWEVAGRKYRNSSSRPSGGQKDRLLAIHFVFLSLPTF